jgi:hypothetical protein
MELLFLVLQNIGLPESNYVQICLGWFKWNGLPSSDKTIIFTDNMANFTTVSACSCQIAEGSSHCARWEFLVFDLLLGFGNPGSGE